MVWFHWYEVPRCLNLLYLGCVITITQPGWLTNNRNIWRRTSPKSRCQHTRCLVRAGFLVHRLLSPHCVLSSEEARELSGPRSEEFSFRKNPIDEGFTLMAWAPPKGPPPNTIHHIGDQISTCAFGGAQTSIPAQRIHIHRDEVKRWSPEAERKREQKVTVQWVQSFSFIRHTLWSWWLQNVNVLISPRGMIKIWLKYSVLGLCLYCLCLHLSLRIVHPPLQLKCPGNQRPHRCVPLGQTSHLRSSLALPALY